MTDTPSDHHDPDVTADPTVDPDVNPPSGRPAPTPAHTTPSRHATPPDHRLQPGQLVADRYRIVAFLGRGGMGEVYRADDLELGQSVALKLLPSRVSADPVLADRVRDEVRLARKITHRNVCRIHDIARLHETDGGDLFISMEYVDGDDLSTLLKRIGRLPQDKAVDVARQLCAALAAAHAEGVIHRDLKPANIMLDGRGAVRLTDFGIAAIVDPAAGPDGPVTGPAASSGTPAYMAPEQYDGREVTTRSDIYALGLVLYELLTGRRAWDASTYAELRTLRDNTATRPALSSSDHRDIDPALAALVDRCLEPDPDDRPASALAVAAALPGADPLAAALAAGETPSPELIAASGGRGVLKPAIAVAFATGAALLITATIILSTRTALLTSTGTPPPPPVMREHAINTIEALGYHDTESVPTRDGWMLSGALARVERAVRAGDAEWNALAHGLNAPLLYWFRREPGGFEPQFPANKVWPDYPARDAAGSTIVHLDHNRDLRFFARHPNSFEPSIDTTEPDWSVAFDLAGLDINDFDPIDARNSPGTDPVVQRAWKGPAPEGSITDGPDIIHVYAGARHGVLSDFEISIPPPDRATNARPDTETTPGDAAPADNDAEPADPPAPAPPTEGPTRIETTLQAAAQWLIIGTITVVAGLLAYRNIRLRRADTRRAVRLAVTIFLLAGLGALLNADVAPTSLARLIGPFPIYGGGVGFAFMAAACYLAAEPLARSRWPGSLVSWTRLFSGNIKDPMVGRDTLLGILVGAAIAALSALGPVLADALEQTARPPNTFGITTTLLGPRHVLADCIAQVSSALINAAAVALIVLLTMLLLGLVRIRQHWPAIAIVTLLIISQQLTQNQLGYTDRIVAVIGNVAILILIGRAGLLATAAALATLNLLNYTAAATPLGEWWTPAAVTPLVLIGAPLLFAYRTATAGRSLFDNPA